MQKKILFFLFFFAVYTQSKATEFITWDISILNKVKNSKEYNSLYSEAIKSKLPKLGKLPKLAY